MEAGYGNTYRVVMLDRLLKAVSGNTYSVVILDRLWKAVSGNTYRVVIFYMLWRLDMLTLTEWSCLTGC